MSILKKICSSDKYYKKTYEQKKTPHKSAFPPFWCVNLELTTTSMNFLYLQEVSGNLILTKGFRKSEEVEISNLKWKRCVKLYYLCLVIKSK